MCIRDRDEVATFNEETTSYQNVLDATTKFELYSETDGDFSMNSKADYDANKNKSNVATDSTGYGGGGTCHPTEWFLGCLLYTS